MGSGFSSLRQPERVNDRSSQDMAVRNHRTRFVPLDLIGDRAIQENIFSKPFLDASNEGIFVDLENLGDDNTPFSDYVEELFTAGFAFQKLNYPNFHGILYNFDDLKKRGRRVFLATSIADLPPEKKPLSGRFKVTDNTATYEFGPAYVTGEDNEEIEIGLTFDEFVALAWNSQIRYGLDADGISQKIAGHFQGRATVAQGVTVVKGEDARFEYLTKVEKDLTPAEDPKTGRLDLKRYKCAFPQVASLANNKIVRKIRATPGTPGYFLTGKIVPAKAGADRDLRLLVSEGTEVVVEKGEEYLVAVRVGYIVVNPSSGKIAVTTEAQNYAPVGPETGSLEIRAEQFIQYNDILIGYSVKCENIDVKTGTVSGEILSTKGAIDISGNVSSGRLIARDGSIRVGGLVTMNSHLESLKGDIVLNRAENSTIVGKNISVKFAYNCTLIGETISVGTVRSSKAAGLSVCFESPQASNTDGEDSVIIIPVLDLTDKRIRVIRHILEEKKAKLAADEGTIQELKGDRLVQAYLEAMKTKNLSAMNILRHHASPLINRINKLSPAVDTDKEEIGRIETNLQGIENQHDNYVETLQKTQRCFIGSTAGEDICLKIYGGLDWPLSFDQLVTEDETTYRNFMALIDSLTKGMGNCKRKGCIQVLKAPCDYDHFALLKLYENAAIIDPTCQDEPMSGGESASQGYRESRVSVISEEDFRQFIKERKPFRSSIEVSVDGLFKGYVHDFSTAELSMLLEKAQKWRPAFECGEKLKLTTNAQGQEHRYDLIVTDIGERPEYLVVAGHFINITPEDEDRLYKIKSRYEVLRKSADQMA